MSNLFRQLSEQASQQRQQIQQLPAAQTDSPPLPAATPHEYATHEQPKPLLQPVATPIQQPSREHKKRKVAPQSGTTAPDKGTTVPQTPPQLDGNKLEIVIHELSQLATNSNGLNVRLSEQEAHDLNEFVHGVLRRRGLKGYEVSAAKLLRYAFRYLSRVHEEEFVSALERALKVEEKLSI